MRNLRLLTAPILTLSLALVGCTANTSTTPDEAETRTIIDHAGTEVTLPADIDRVAVDEIPIASTYLAYFQGEAPHLVGMSGAVVDALEGTVAEKIAPEILDVETSYADDGELNIESLMTLDPQVVFYNANNTEHAEQFASAGIPAVGFATSGDPATVYADWLRLLEQVFGEPGRMDEVIDYGAELVDRARETNATVSESDRAKALIIFTYRSGTLTVAGEPEFFGSFWLDTANATNSAIGTTQPLAQVSTEQVLAWDPDTILVSGAGQAGISPEQIIDGTAEGLDLSTLSAVKDREVFTTQLGMWSWFTPNPDAPLVASWIGAALYPELYTEDDIRQETRDYYELAYDYSLSTDDLDTIFRASLPG